MTLRSKVVEFRDVRLQGDLSYVKRYWLSGNVSASAYIAESDMSVNRRWDVNYEHRQTLTPDETFTLTGRGSLMGDQSYHENTSDSLEEIINKRISANMSLTKSAFVSAALSTRRAV